MATQTYDLMLEKWEIQRELKNLMGKYVNCILLNRESELCELFWSKRPDACMGRNDGWYLGLKQIAAYYDEIHNHVAAVAAVLSRQYPEESGGKTPEELFGAGEFKVRPLSAPVIEVADDMETAQGLWYCMGTEARVSEAGPVAYWTWGYYAVDFVNEGGDWKIWHLQYLKDVDCICGQSWGKPEEAYPELEEFAELKGWTPVKPAHPCVLREGYTPKRRLIPAPRIPQPYATFSDIESYGMEEV